MEKSEPKSTDLKLCRQPLARHEYGDFEPLVTPVEASSYLRLHHKTVIRMARQRLLPAIRLGKHWRFRQSDLLDWAQSKVELASQLFEC